MVISLFSIVVMIVGILIWALASNPKLVEAGRIAYFCGLLVLTWSLSHHVVRVG